VVPNPEPNESIRALDRKRSMGQANANGMELSDFLKVKRRMLRVGFEKLKILFRQGPNLFGQ